jgi:ATP-dependent Zn protease
VAANPVLQCLPLSPPTTLQHSIDMPDFESAIDRVIGGLEKKNKVGMFVAVSSKTKDYQAYTHALLWLSLH